MNAGRWSPPGWFGVVIFTFVSSVGIAATATAQVNFFRQDLATGAFAGISGESPLVLADLDSDGRQDLVLANVATGTISVYLDIITVLDRKDYPNGAGAGAEIHDMTVADLNSDGILDLVATIPSSQVVTVFRGRGDGTFQTPLSYAAGASAARLAVKDVDRNGKLDVVVGNDTGFSVLLGDGSGALGPKTTTTVAGGSTSDIAVADFNKDGRLDIAVAHTGNLSFYSGNGNGTFTPGPQNNSLGIADQLAVADLDRDGILDVVTAGALSSPARYYRGTGAGSFNLTYELLPACGCTDVVITDSNADGKLDVVVVANTFSNAVFLAGDGAGGFASGVTIATQSNPRRVQAADMDADGRIDLVVSTVAGVTTATSLLRNFTTLTFAGSFAPRTDITAAAATRGIAAGDLDANGRPDIIVTYGLSGGASATVFRQLTALTFTGANLATGSRPAGIAIADFNRDGRDDFVVANNSSSNASLYLATAPGVFGGAPVTLPTGLSPWGVTAADLNQDGRADLAFANQASDTISILLGNGDGTFVGKPAPATGDNPNTVVAADFNRDGVLDLVTENANDNSISLLIGNGDGTFQAKADHAGGSLPLALAVADLNGDTALDVVLANFLGSSMTVFWGDGGGGFPFRQDFTTGVAAANGVTIADFNRDGRPDVAVVGSSKVAMLLGTGGRVFGDAIPFTAAGGAFSIVAADIDLDGRVDLAVSNTSNASFSTFLNTAPPAGDLTVTMTSSPTNPVAGDLVTHTMTVTNPGATAVASVLLINNLPSAQFAASASSGSCAVASRVFSCSLGTLAAGASTIVTLDVRPVSTVIQFTRVAVTGYLSDSTNNNLTTTNHVPSAPPVNALLNIRTKGSGGGAVRGDSINLSCASCFTSFAAGAGIQLTAVPTPGSRFKEWSGACSGSASCFVTLNTSQTVVASFAAALVDEPVTSGVSVIRAVHVTQLRAAIDRARAAASYVGPDLNPYVYTDPALAAGFMMKAVHLMEMRTALAEAYASLGLPAPTYTNAVIAAGEPITALDLTELRNALRALE